MREVNAGTGLMLSLHNWGGTGFIGAPDPGVLSSRYNVVAIGVDYLQSGEGAPPETGFPYDTGYLQTMDALRALYVVYDGLRQASVAFDTQRLYACGGSGGGNVSLMANKLAPSTFACIVDLSGLASLTDGVAYGDPEGVDIRAGYTRDAAHPNYLPRHGQLIRDPGYDAHIGVMMAAGNSARIISIHGEDDASCDVSDKRRVLDALRRKGAEVHAHYISRVDIDGDLITESGHSIGNRTRLLQHFADPFLLPRSQECQRLTTPCDFDQRRNVVFPTDDVVYTVDYSRGYPVIGYA
jgi:hypothetical protein